MGERVLVSLAALSVILVGTTLLARAWRGGRIWSGGAVYRRTESAWVFFGIFATYVAMLAILAYFVLALWFGR
jgi:hypothetical protein